MTSSEQKPLREPVGKLHLETARKLLKAQKGFSQHLGIQFVTNASIGILLHCFIMDAEAKTCFVDDVINQYGTSSTNAWRWIVAMQDSGLVHVTRQGLSAQLSLTSRGLEHLIAILDDAE